jgi:hypothetical protein
MKIFIYNALYAGLNANLQLSDIVIELVKTKAVCWSQGGHSPVFLFDVADAQPVNNTHYTLPERPSSSDLCPHPISTN